MYSGAVLLFVAQLTVIGFLYHGRKWAWWLTLAVLIFGTLAQLLSPAENGIHYHMAGLNVWLQAALSIIVVVFLLMPATRKWIKHSSAQ